MRANWRVDGSLGALGVFCIGVSGVQSGVDLFEYSPTVYGVNGVADRGNHDNTLLAECAYFGIRTHIPDRKQAKWMWVNKPLEMQELLPAIRRRVRGERGRRVNRWKSQQMERTFAHVREKGGARRAEKLAASVVYRAEGASAAVQCLQSGVADAEMPRNGQAAHRRLRRDRHFGPSDHCRVSSPRQLSPPRPPHTTPIVCTDPAPIRQGTTYQYRTKYHQTLT